MDRSAHLGRLVGEVVTASLLNTHLRDNMKVGRGYQRAVRTAGSITLNSTAWANTSTTLDLTLAASTGDVVSAGVSMVRNSEAVVGFFNCTFVASGAGFSTRTANTDGGVTAWQAGASIQTGAGATVSKTVASADISGGNVIVRRRHRTLTAANKTLFATTAFPWAVEAYNIGPHVAP